MRLLTKIGTGSGASSRQIKPEIPAMGEFGIPIRDELELEMTL